MLSFKKKPKNTMGAESALNTLTNHKKVITTIPELFDALITSKNYEDLLDMISPIITAKLLGDNTKTIIDIIQMLKDVPNLDIVCGKVISKGAVYYRCLDCDKYSASSTLDNKPGNAMDRLVYAIQCKECFEKSNHKGHRISQYISNDDSGVCDCGDHDAWNNNGFCTLHSGYIKDKVEEVLHKLPKNLANNFIDTFTEIFFQVFQMIEKYQLKTLNDNNLKDQNHYQPHHEILELTLVKVLTPLQLLLNIHGGFKLLLTEIFKSRFEISSKLLSHQCSNVTKLVLYPTKSPCICTILENLFRYNNTFSRQLQLTIRNIYIDMLPIKEFRRYLGITIAKMISMLYDVKESGPNGVDLITYLNKIYTNGHLNPPKNNDNNDYVILNVSEIANISTQLYNHEDICISLIESKNIEHLAKHALKILNTVPEKYWNIIQEHFLNLLLMIEQITEQVIPCQKLLTKSEIITTLLELMHRICNKKTCALNDSAIYIWIEDNYQSILTTSLFEYKLLKIFLNLMKGITTLEFNHPNRVLILKSLANIFKTKLAHLKNEYTDKYMKLYINNGIMRVFCLFICTCLQPYIQHIDKESIIDVFRKYFDFKDNNELEQFVQLIIKKTINTIIFLLTIKQFWKTMAFEESHLKVELEKTLFNYSLPINLAFDCDIALLQIFGLLTSDKSNIFQLYTHMIDIPYVINSPIRTEKLLNFILYLICDEISILNIYLALGIIQIQGSQAKLIQSSSKLNSNLNLNTPKKFDHNTHSTPITNPSIKTNSEVKPDLKEDQYGNFKSEDNKHIEGLGSDDYDDDKMEKNSINIIKDVLINAFQMHYSLVNFKDIKNEVNAILNSRIKIEECIELVGDYQANSKKFKLKSIYDNVYNPNIFDKSEKMSTKFKEKLREKFEKNKGYDSIFGNHCERHMKFGNQLAFIFFSNKKLLAFIYEKFLKNSKVFISHHKFIMRIATIGLELLNYHENNQSKNNNSGMNSSQDNIQNLQNEIILETYSNDNQNESSKSSLKNLKNYGFHQILDGLDPNPVSKIDSSNMKIQCLKNTTEKLNHENQAKKWIRVFFVDDDLFSFQLTNLLGIDKHSDLKISIEYILSLIKVSLLNIQNSLSISQGPFAQNSPPQSSKNDRPNSLSNISPIKLEDKIQTINQERENKKALTDSIRKKKQEEMLKQFSKRRMSFLDTTNSLINKTESEEICPYCHEDFNNAELDFGIPAYVSLSNFNNMSLYSMSNVVNEKHKITQDKEAKTKYHGYLVINGCDHYLHYKCFEYYNSITKQSHQSEGLEKNEYQCMVCKSVCNVWLPLKSTTKGLIDKHKIYDLNRKEKKILKFSEYEKILQKEILNYFMNPMYSMEKIKHTNSPRLTKFTAINDGIKTIGIGYDNTLDDDDNDDSDMHNNFDEDDCNFLIPEETSANYPNKSTPTMMAHPSFQDDLFEDFMNNMIIEYIRGISKLYNGVNGSNNLASSLELEGDLVIINMIINAIKSSSYLGYDYFLNKSIFIIMNIYEQYTNNIIRNKHELKHYIEINIFSKFKQFFIIMNQKNQQITRDFFDLNNDNDDLDSICSLGQIFEDTFLNLMLNLAILYYGKLEQEIVFYELFIFTAMTCLFVVAFKIYYQHIIAQQAIKIDETNIAKTIEQQILPNFINEFVYTSHQRNPSYMAKLNPIMKRILTEISSLGALALLSDMIMENYVLFNSLNFDDGIELVFRNIHAPNLEKSSKLSVFYEKNKTYIDTLLYNICSCMVKNPNIQRNDPSLSILSLDTNYMAFMASYQNSKCQKCGQISQKSSLVICLLCGIALCKSECRSSASLKNNSHGKIGNLNEHAKQYHCGNSVYIGTFCPSILMVSYPKNIVYNKNLYYDKYGQEFEPHNSNWEDFKLNSDTYEIIKKLIFTNKLRQEISYELLKSSNKIRDGLL